MRHIDNGALAEYLGGSTVIVGSQQRHGSVRLGNDAMNALSVNSISNIYVRTAVAQQRVAVDRGNVLETEAQLSDYRQQLDEDLTYLSKLQRRNHEVQQLEGNQAQTPELVRIEKNSQSAQQASQQAIASLSSAISANRTIGMNVDIVA